MKTLPSLRRKIFRSFSILVGLYAIFGVLLAIAVTIASRNTPKALHRNYDTIAAMIAMDKAWDALRTPREYPQRKESEWIAEFENNLQFEERNITEPGEKEAAAEIREIWKQYRESPNQVDQSSITRMRETISAIITMNEKAMFGLAEENARLNQVVLGGGAIYFLISLVLAVLFADRLATRLAAPIKQVAETLQSNPAIDRHLRLPDPRSLELLILNQQLTDLWGRLRQMSQLNYAELLRQKSKLEAVLQSVEDAVLVIEGSGEIAHCNTLMLELLELPSDQVIGQPFQDLPTLSENYLKLRSALSEEVTEGTEIDLLLSGIKRNYAIRYRRIARPGWSHSASLFLIHDITEKRQRARLRTEIVDWLSHELKTPLQSLGTASDLLTDKKASIPEELQVLIDTVAEDVQRIRGVANEFAQVTQANAKALRLKLDHVALNAVIEDWLKPFRILAKDKELKIELVNEGSEVIYANVDTVKFPWAVSNIVSNAVRYSPKGGTISVLLSDRNGAVEIRVTDEGPGISPADRPRIFDPFFQAKAQSQDGMRGLFGVGLTIAKEVVEAHDGRIEYHPGDPVGSVFRILLPLADHHLT